MRILSDDGIDAAIWWRRVILGISMGNADNVMGRTGELGNDPESSGRLQKCIGKAFGIIGGNQLLKHFYKDEQYSGFRQLMPKCSVGRHEKSR